MPVGVTRWTFFDPTDSSTYEFAINPNEGGSPDYRKNITYTNTAGQNGNVLAFEGRDAPKQHTISGTILTQVHLEAFVTWFEKRHAITVTDDLLRTFSIYITGFAPRRQRSALHPYKHTYTMTYVELDWP